MNGMLLFLLAAIASVPTDDTPTPAEPTLTQEISFPSGDGLKITADLYMAHESKKTPFIVLFHQAGWSRGEYREIAPKLNARGYNCLAIDQRSGKGVNDVNNETATRAAEEGKGTTFVDAHADVIAALEYARKNFAKGKMIAWGSSYSAALVLRVAGERPDLVDGVLSFAPGEYFTRFGKSATWVAETAAKIDDPVFVTSAHKEQKNWQPIYDAIGSKEKSFFLPETAGNHGSRALWEQFDDSPDYWREVDRFLTEHFPSKEKGDATKGDATKRDATKGENES